jgi:hypothetical protein
MYAIMKEIRHKYSIFPMYRVLSVSPSGYYKWLNFKPSKHVREETRLEAEIKAAHTRTRET